MSRVRITSGTMERSKQYTGFVFLLLLHQSGSVLDVMVPSSHNAPIGSTTLLSCLFTIDNSPIQSSFLAILWFHGDKQLLRYDSKGIVLSHRVSFDEEEAKNGNASMSIHNVIISDQGTYKCLVIYSPEKQEKEILLNTQAVPVVNAYKKFLKNGKKILLCSVMGFYPKAINVTWLWNGQALVGSVMENFQMNVDGTYNVNSSVTVTSVEAKENPNITCLVEHESLRDPIRDGFILEYGAVPKIKLLSSDNGDDQTFVCEAQGFPSEAIELYWLLDGKKTKRARRNVDGSYNNCRLYTIDGQQQKRTENISCLVEHDTLHEPLILTLPVKPRKVENSQTTSLVIAVILTMSLTLCGTVSVLWLLVFKKKYFQEFQVSHIHKDERWTEDKVTLYCLASNCKKDIKVTWTVTEASGAKITLRDSQTCGVEESGQLLDMYIARSEQSLMDGLHNVFTSLSFTPVVSMHKNMKVVCKFFCNGKSREQHWKCSFQSLKPQLLYPINLSLDDLGEVLCSVTLDGFYPSTIHVKWSCGVGCYQDLDNTKHNILKSTDSTFNIKSECRVPGNLFKDPGFKVRVTWSHQSQDEPRYWEVSAADFPWRPVMDEITIPPLLHSTEAKLQCRIYGYFPGDLDVMWMRREPGKQEMYPVCPSDKYKIPVLGITQGSDKTFTCTASLIVSVSAVTEHGAEFICWVKHPTLSTPLEKKTGELSVRGIPVVRNFFQDDVHIILDVDSFYPQELRVTWERTSSKNDPYKSILDSDIRNYSSVSGDNSYRIISICAAMKVTDLLDPADRYFKATVEHEALKYPIQLIFLRSKGKFYFISESERRQLQKTEWRTLVSAPSGLLQKSPEKLEAGESDENPA